MFSVEEGFAPNRYYGQEPLVASLLLAVRPGAPSSFLLVVKLPQEFRNKMNSASASSRTLPPPPLP